MPDVFSEAKRSIVMAGIRGRGNLGTEIRFMQLLRRCHISGWRRHQRINLSRDRRGEGGAAARRSRIVHPDFMFRKSKILIFIDGCFWHGCPRHASMPENNRSFWKKKLRANVMRDNRTRRKLREMGWRTIRIWEHDLTASRRSIVEKRLARIFENLRDV